MDPRVKTPVSGLQKQFDLEMRLASAVSESSEAVTQARSIHEQLGKLATSGKLQLPPSLWTKESLFCSKQPKMLLKHLR